LGYNPRDGFLHNVRQLHQGKEGKPTVAYSLIADHSRRTRSVTVGHPGARNDKFICQYDTTIQDIRSKRLYHDKTFILFASDASGVPWQHMGLYLICNEGSHKWHPYNVQTNMPLGRVKLADFPEFRMDRRIIDLWSGLVDRRYVGVAKIDNWDVEVECKWTQLQGALIENHMHFYPLNKIEW
jgi:hypothetical protein